jgi:hypothetical protein
MPTIDNLIIINGYDPASNITTLIVKVNEDGVIHIIGHFIGQLPNIHIRKNNRQPTPSETIYSLLVTDSFNTLHAFDLTVVDNSITEES